MYDCEIIDRFPACPGTVRQGPFATRKEAQWFGEREIAAAAELFKDGAAFLSFRVVERQP